ncbi:barstar family protein [Paenibacillus sp. DCT19]|uniref:barstar family protein n=1 Tax=Paenibacillus sp. DCT19 TaxID=2211212 RepID=UPI000FE266BB|nr:barstar family protein [Paenibacillus sp. DCT19]
MQLRIALVRIRVELFPIMRIRSVGDIDVPSFPEFYGMNWDAFWDAIAGLVDMPQKLILVGWESVEDHIPQDAARMKELLNRLNEKHPTWACEVQYVSF